VKISSGFVTYLFGLMDHLALHKMVEGVVESTAVRTVVQLS
jgi:hypothetical protein